MRKVLLFSLLAICSSLSEQCYGQTIFSTNFNSSLPAGWTIDASAGATWAHNGSLGTGGSGCAMVDQSSSSGGTKGKLITTSFNLTTVPKPTLSFKVASIRNNFMSPNLYIYYSVAGGAWQKLSSWGEWNTDNIINTTGPCFPNNNGCVEWQDVVFDLAKVAGNTNIRFAFEADCLNGGWLLLDDLWIHDKKIYALPYTQDFEGNAFFPQDWDRTGTDKNTDWQRSVAVGAFNSTSSAFFDNFSLNVSGSFYGLSTVWLNLSTAAKPTLAFEYAYTQRAGKPSDELRISYQVGNNGTWIVLDSFKENKLRTAPNKSVAFVPTNREWLTKTIDISSLSSNQEIRFALECKSQNGNILYIDNVRFFDDTATTTVATIENASQYRLYPNPAQNSIYIDMQNDKGVSAYVYDITGRQMSSVTYERTGQRLEVNTTSLSSGAYYIYIEQEGVVATKQFFINK
ncbi:MAG: T9SS type A sorting domain-containing protein [Flavipsychrobacter sp.]